MRRVAAVFAAVCLLALLAGCAGNGRIDRAALNYREIDEGGAQFTRIHADRCAWWADASGRVWIAMDAAPATWWAPARQAFAFALAVEKLSPQGKGEYLVSRRELQAAMRLSGRAERCTAVAGVVSIQRADGDRLTGAFRLEVVEQSPNRLSGWGRGERQLLVGEFDAVRDAGDRVRVIADHLAGGDVPRPADSGEHGAER